MALEVLDKDETLKFYPEGKEVENPTIIHLSKADARDSIRYRALYKRTWTEKGGIEITMTDDDIWFDYICKRVVKIENIIYKGELKTIEDPKLIAEILDGPLSRNIGRELFDFIQESSLMTEDQAKN